MSVIKRGLKPHHQLGSLKSCNSPATVLVNQDNQITQKWFVPYEIMTIAEPSLCFTKACSDHCLYRYSLASRRIKSPHQHSFHSYLCRFSGSIGKQSQNSNQWERVREYVFTSTLNMFNEYISQILT